MLHPLWKRSGPEQFHDRELEDGWFEYLQRITPDVAEQQACNDELMIFRRDRLTYQRAVTQDRVGHLRPVSWWDKYGGCTPRLQRIALRVLSQDCTSAACERNWSIYSLIHTKKRNRLSTEQLERLVFVHSNLRLLDNMREAKEPLQVIV